MQALSSITIMPPEPMIDPTSFKRFIVHRKIEKLFRDAAAGRSAGLHCFEPVPFGYAAANFKNNLPQRRAHGHFNQTHIPHFSAERKYFRPFAFLRAQRGIPFATPPQDGWNVGERFHVVDQRGHLPQARLRRKWRPRPRRAPPAFNGSDQRGLFPADECAAADADFNIEAELRVADLTAQKAQPPRLANARSATA